MIRFSDRTMMTLAAQILLNIAAPLGVASLLVSCGAASGTSVKFHAPAGGGGGGQGGNVGDKPLPALSKVDRFMTLFQELNRAQHTLENFVTPPTTSKAPGKGNGCVSYNAATRSGHGLFLTALYADCTFTQTQSTDQIGLSFKINGIETYRDFAANADGKSGAYSRSDSKLQIVVSTLNPARIIGKTTLARGMTVRTGLNSVYLVDMIATWGTKENYGSDFWESEIDQGSWLVAKPFDSVSLTSSQQLVMQTGTMMKLTYRSASAPVAKKVNPATPFEMTLTALEPIEFVSGCHWPKKGSFNWTETYNGVPTSGDITVTPEGFTESTGQKHIWPTHCLERN